MILKKLLNIKKAKRLSSNEFTLLSFLCSLGQQNIILSNPKVAQEIGLSLSTIKVCLKSLMQKDLCFLERKTNRKIIVLKDVPFYDTKDRLTQRDKDQDQSHHGNNFTGYDFKGGKTIDNIATLKDTASGMGETSIADTPRGDTSRGEAIGQGLTGHFLTEETLKGGKMIDPTVTLKDKTKNDIIRQNGTTGGNLTGQSSTGGEATGQSSTGQSRSPINQDPPYDKAFSPLRSLEDPRDTDFENLLYFSQKVPEIEDLFNKKKYNNIHIDSIINNEQMIKYIYHYCQEARKEVKARWNLNSVVCPGGTLKISRVQFANVQKALQIAQKIAKESKITFTLRDILDIIDLKRKVCLKDMAIAIKYTQYIKAESLFNKNTLLKNLLALKSPKNDGWYKSKAFLEPQFNALGNNRGMHHHEKANQRVLDKKIQNEEQYQSYWSDYYLM